MQFKRVVVVYNERIAAALEGIHKELKRLNDTNPSNRAKAKQKEPEKKEFKPKNFIWGGTYVKAWSSWSWRYRANISSVGYVNLLDLSKSLNCSILKNTERA